MLRSYLTAAMRSLLKNKIYSIINVLGLAIGLGCFVLVIAYNRKELSYDIQFTRAESIYRIHTTLDINGAPEHYPMSHFPAGEDMTEELPEVGGERRFHRPNLFNTNVHRVA